MKDRNKRPLFQYLEGFGGVELIQTKNEEGTEYAAWVRNRGNIGGTVWLGSSIRKIGRSLRMLSTK